jgi:hypothetical protein
VPAPQRPGAAGSGHALTRAQLRSGAACLRQAKPSRGLVSLSYCLLLAEPSPASCNIIIFKAISNNDVVLYLQENPRMTLFIDISRVAEKICC